MSCGDHHDTDCGEVLDECSPCLAQYGLDEKLKKLLAAKCGGEHAPAGLKDRLREKLRGAVVEQAALAVDSVTVESDGTTTTVEVRSSTTRVERY
jgi:mycothiol system anti-sigma-R factor